MTKIMQDDALEDSRGGSDVAAGKNNLSERSGLAGYRMFSRISRFRQISSSMDFENFSPSEKKSGRGEPLVSL